MSIRDGYITTPRVCSSSYTIPYLVNLLLLQNCAFDFVLRLISSLLSILYLILL